MQYTLTSSHSHRIHCYQTAHAIQHAHRHCRRPTAFPSFVAFSSAIVRMQRRVVGTAQIQVGREPGGFPLPCVSSPSHLPSGFTEPPCHPTACLHRRHDRPLPRITAPVARMAPDSLPIERISHHTQQSTKKRASGASPLPEFDTSPPAAHTTSGAAPCALQVHHHALATCAKTFPGASFLRSSWCW